MARQRTVLSVAILMLVGASALVFVGARTYDFAGSIGSGVAGAGSSPSGHGNDTHKGNGVAVQAAVAKLRDFPVVIHTFGNVAAPDTVVIAARAASQVTAIHVKDGQMVKAGDLLFSLDDRVEKADLARDEANLAKDNALLSAANSALDRARVLRDENTGTQQAYETALSVQQSTQATVEADKATIEADKVAVSLLTITAPIDGRLGAVQVAIGDLVGPSNSASNDLVTITAINPIEVTFRLPEDRLQPFKQLLDSGKPSKVIARASGTDTVLGQGVLDFIDSAVDTASGTITMRGTFANDDQKLWPGQYVDVDIEQETLPQMPVIPTVAVQFGQSGPFVYRVNGDNTVEASPVVVRTDDGTDSAISSGVAAGDMIVVEGQSRLKPRDKVSVSPADTAMD